MLGGLIPNAGLTGKAINPSRLASVRELSLDSGKRKPLITRKCLVLLGMAKQARDIAADLEEASKTLRQMAKTAGDDFREGVEKGKKVVQEHPKAALGIALGAAFAAGVVAGVELRRARKSEPEK